MTGLAALMQTARPSRSRRREPLPPTSPAAGRSRSLFLEPAATTRRTARRDQCRRIGGRPYRHLVKLFDAFGGLRTPVNPACRAARSEEHTSELQSPCNLVCRLLLEKKKKNDDTKHHPSTQRGLR